MNLLEHAPPDRECDKAFAGIVAEAREAGIEVTSGITIAVLSLDDTRGVRRGDPEAWERLMKRARDHCLIVQAYSGTATLITPAAQREEGHRAGVLSAHDRIETKAWCDQQFAEVLEEAEALNLVQFSGDGVAEVIEGRGPRWNALLEKAKQVRAVVRYVRRSAGQEDGGEPDYNNAWLVYLFATTEAQRAAPAAPARAGFGRSRGPAGRRAVDMKTPPKAGLPPLNGSRKIPRVGSGKTRK